MQTFTVKENSDLFSYLEKVLHGIKRSTLKNYLRFEAVFVNGKPVTRHDYRLKPGDQVTIEKDKQKSEVNRMRSDLKIIYEDDDIIVVDKEPGLLSISTFKVRSETAFYQVYEYLKAKSIFSAGARHAVPPHKQQGPSKLLFIVHRLDKDASGLMIFAKTAEAKMDLQENWHQFEKKYYAVVEGTPTEPAGEISSYLKENSILRVFASKKSSEGAKLAQTHYEVIQSVGNRSLLEVTLRTGRKHQIRVQLTSLGHPILGDKDYGNPDLSKRLALHAYSLSVTHPVTKKKLHFKTDLPQELKQLMKN